jgi:hypothetical protein
MLFVNVLLELVGEVDGAGHSKPMVFTHHKAQDEGYK